ncbi:MAG TPA: hypothetical protein VJ346_05405, partial [Bacteroidales bacterium]|nr:hypothetical protein [Bacteroidales bacterium]
DKMYLQQMAFIVNMADSINFNQIKGRDMICYFENNELYKIDVRGNGESVYYLVEDNEIIGVNRSQSSNIVIYWADGKVQSIRSEPSPNATLYPLDEFPETESRLRDFKWLEDNRPKNKYEIFYWTE